MLPKWDFKEEYKTIEDICDEENKNLFIDFNDLPSYIKEEIEEYCNNNDQKLDLLLQSKNNKISLQTTMDFYLQWNGISGYTNTIMTLVLKSKLGKLERIS